MKCRKVTLTLDECSEIRVLISRSIETIKPKFDTLCDCTSPDDPYDVLLLSFWRDKLSVLMSAFSKLRSNDFCEVKE